MTEKSYIPFHRPSIGKEESDAVQKVLILRLADHRAGHHRV